MSTQLTCRELIDFLDDYVEARQPPALRADFERHLALCIACREYLQTYRDTIALARRTADDASPPSDAPPDLIHAVLKSLQRH